MALKPAVTPRVRPVEGQEAALETGPCDVVVRQPKTCSPFVSKSPTDPELRAAQITKYQHRICVACQHLYLGQKAPCFLLS